PDAVLNTTRARFHQANLLGQAVPDGASIAQLYDQASDELLILGDPGSGKTTLLFQLAVVLQQRAVHDASAPVPVVVNLSTWTNARQPSLQEWLIEEIVRTYQIPRDPLIQMVQEEQILPLLDGLDDVEESARTACIRSINT